MPELIDLHIHSNKSSDGDVAPREIIHLARENNLKAISIADHDTVAAYPDALQIGKSAGVEVIPGMELTTRYKEREFHLLLPFISYDAEYVAALEAEVKSRRLSEGEERVARLQELGFAIQWEDVVKRTAPFPPLGVTIAQYVLEQKNQTSLLAEYRREENRRLAPYIFYRDFFMEGKPAYVTPRNISLSAVLAKAGDTGGVPVLAHPGAPFQNVSEADLRDLKSRGLQGLEVYSSYHDQEQIKYYFALAEKYDLIPTAGSDFHGSIKPDISFGSIQGGGYWMVDELRKRRP